MAAGDDEPGRRAGGTAEEAPPEEALGEFAAAAALLGEATHWSRRFAERLGGAKATKKSDASPVTAADLALQALLVLGLRERYGSESIVGEESTAVFSAAGGSEFRASVHALVRSVRPELPAEEIDDAIDRGRGDGLSDVQWVIDPIDGTRGYLGGQQYCTCLALVRERVVVFGAAGCPRLGEDGRFFASCLGRGTWAWEGIRPSGLGRKARARAERRDPAIVCQSRYISERAHRRMRLMGDALAAPLESRLVDSQCKFVLVAGGDADLAMRLPSREPSAGVDMVWDYAGAMLMVEEAGGHMTDCDGAALRFGRGRAIEGNRGILAAAPWLHRAAIEALPEADRRLAAAERTGD